jgi:hypothetical protein
MGQIHYEVFVRKPGAAGWSLELATEDRQRAAETAEEMVASGKAVAAKVTKETLDEETREFKSVTILTKGDPGKAEKKKPKDDIQPLCVSPQDLYTIHAREQIGRLLEGWLNREKATPSELLHRPDLIEKLDAAGMDLQHAIQKIAIPEAQDRGVSVHEVIRHFQGLVQKAIDRVLKDAKKRAFPDLVNESFAMAAERVMHDGERGYLLSGGVAGYIADARTWAEKVNRILDLADQAPQSPGPRALAFHVLETPLAEILASRAGLAEIIGPDLDLGGNLAAMTRLAASDTVDAIASIDARVARLLPPLSGAAARLANWLEGDKFPEVRTALASRVLRELAQPRRLRPSDPEGEIEILRALAMCLTAAASKRMPPEQVQDAFTERSKMLVRGDFVESYLGQDRTPLGEVEALIWLAENVTGPANKRAASRWVAANITALKFERELRASPDSPATKLSSLAAIQKSVARVGFVPEELGPIQAKIGEIAGLIEADARLVSLVAKASAPAHHRLTLLLKLATGETCPLGPAADRAKAEALKMMRAADIRDELSRTPENLGKVREMMQTLGVAA